MKNNYVAKYAGRLNKSRVFKDKKKAAKRGETKNRVITLHKLERNQIAA